MADYRTLAIKLISTNGKADGHIIKLLKKVLLNDGKLAEEEVAFLADLRAAMIAKKTKRVTSKFDSFYLKSLQNGFLGAGVVSADEIAKISELVIADDTLKTSAKKKFLDGLKKKATLVAPEFDELYAKLKK
jgi:hypothetical protein